MHIYSFIEQSEIKSGESRSHNNHYPRAITYEPLVPALYLEIYTINATAQQYLLKSPPRIDYLNESSRVGGVIQTSSPRTTTTARLPKQINH